MTNRGATAGPVYEHAITGARIRFRDTDDENVRLDIWAPPGTRPFAKHVHPKQDESFEVVSGAIRLEVADEEHVLSEGDDYTVPAGTPHTWLTDGDEEFHAILELRPGLHAREVLISIFSWGGAGKTDKTGRPHFLQRMVLLDAYPGEIYLAGPPIALQRALASILAPVGRLFGYKVRYD